MPLLEVLSLAAMFLMALHLGALVLYNRYRIRQLLYYFSLCRGRELSEADYLDLVEEYTSFLGFASFSPNRTYYADLYTHTAFATFVRRSKRIMRYLAGVMGGGFLGMLFVALVQQ